MVEWSRYYWANQRLLDVISELAPEQFDRDLGGSVPSIHATLAHMMTAEAIWLGRIRRGEPGPRIEPAEVPDAASVRARWAELEREVRALVDGLDAAGLERPVPRPRGGRIQYLPASQVLHHLFNHGTYHRGQLTTLLRQVGATPVSTDLSQYYSEGQS